MFQNINQHNLALFLSQGISLAAWKKIGILAREIEPYNLLAQHFKNIYIFSYGNETEKKYPKLLAPNIKIIPNSQEIHPSRYVYQMSFRRRKIIRHCRFLKTEQVSGASAAVLAKIIHPEARLIIRVGYPLSFNLKQKNHWVAFLRASLLELIAFNLASTCLVTSKQIKKDVSKKIIFGKRKVHQIANYINTERFKPFPKTPKYQSRLLYIGRLSWEKNLSNLIKALTKTNLKLDLVGRGEDKKKLKAAAKKFKVKINFLGTRSNHQLPKIINQYSVFVLPSFYEGMPKSLLEAMSCGLACVATKVRGNLEIIQNKQTGLLSPTSAAGLRKQILYLFYNKKLQRKIGQNARNFVKENFSLQRQIKKEIKIYEKLV